jgi:predicted AAA+ superfamily ATPase
VKLLNRGYLPSHYDDPDFALGLRSYVGDYLKEEILAEGLTRSLPVFTRFLEVAALSDSETINFSNIARECGISSKTTQAYFEILQDTLVGEFLPAFTTRPKRRTNKAPKFYFHDVGIVNFLSSRRNLLPRSAEFGKAFENWIFHELSCFRKYSKSDYPLSFWHLSSGIEVDFILGNMEVAIEAKTSSTINDNHLKGLRELKRDFPEVKERLVVCMEEHLRQTHDGITIMPYQIFVDRIWSLPLTPDVKPRLT